MRLTPADVHNVAFKKPSIGKRGYDEDEVDAFLDLVEAELSRLIEENNELTQRLAAAQAGVAPTDQVSHYEPEAAPQYVEPPRVEADHEQAAVDAVPVSVQKAEPVAASAAAPAAPANSEAAYMQAARLLGLAQETAERLTTEAATEAETTRAAAKAESEKVLSEATAEANRLLSDAQSRSESLLSEATATSEALERDSRVRADALDRESQSKYTEAMGQLSEQRIVLEKKIDDLRVYEREYRSRLKSWISDQLAQLDESGGSNNNDQYAQQGAE